MTDTQILSLIHVHPWFNVLPLGGAPSHSQQSKAVRASQDDRF